MPSKSIICPSNMIESFQMAQNMATSTDLVIKLNCMNSLCESHYIETKTGWLLACTEDAVFMMWSAQHVSFMCVCPFVHQIEIHVAVVVMYRNCPSQRTYGPFLSWQFASQQIYLEHLSTNQMFKLAKLLKLMRMLKLLSHRQHWEYRNIDEQTWYFGSTQRNETQHSKTIFWPNILILMYLNVHTQIIHHWLCQSNSKMIYYIRFLHNENAASLHLLALLVTHIFCIDCAIDVDSSMFPFDWSVFIIIRLARISHLDSFHFISTFAAFAN